ncbi:hypothetical protein ABKN59_006917 [Abortiporus biennis]
MIGPLVPEILRLHQPTLPSSFFGSKSVLYVLCRSNITKSTRNLFKIRYAVQDCHSHLETGHYGTWQATSVANSLVHFQLSLLAQQVSSARYSAPSQLFSSLEILTAPAEPLRIYREYVSLGKGAVSATRKVEDKRLPKENPRHCEWSEWGRTCSLPSR